MKFSPCIKECTKTGTHCEGCGRNRDDVLEMKALVAGLITFAKKMEYDNIEEFADSVAHTIKYKMGVNR